MQKPERFDIQWDADAVEKLLDRVRAYEFPKAPADAGWEYGCDPNALRDLCAYWGDGYDWRAAVATLNAREHFLADIDGKALHFVHVVGEAGGKRPLLLSHGWPSSVFEFWDVIDALAYPSQHGGRTEDAFDLVIPSLPGFGWSYKPAVPVDQIETAHLYDALMTRVLGYDTYFAAGGDWGAMVTAMAALHHPEHVRATLMTMLFPQPSGEPETREEKAWQKDARAVERQFGAYAAVQGSKPQSLAWLAAGNPVGQMAWIVERFHDWSDRRDRSFDDIFTRDRLLTNVMIYVMNDAFTTSLWYYAAAIASDTRKLKPGQRITTPTAFTIYEDPRHPKPPRSIAEKGYAVSRWVQPGRGGHFPALEVPQTYIEDLRAWGRET